MNRSEIGLCGNARSARPPWRAAAQINAEIEAAVQAMERDRAESERLRAAKQAESDDRK